MSRFDDLRSYPKCKDSGLPWLGRIPAHWGVIAAKRLFTQRKERALPDDERCPQLSLTASFYGLYCSANMTSKINCGTCTIAQHSHIETPTSLE